MKVRIINRQKIEDGRKVSDWDFFEIYSDFNGNVPLYSEPMTWKELKEVQKAINDFIEKKEKTWLK